VTVSLGQIYVPALIVIYIRADAFLFADVPYSSSSCHWLSLVGAALSIGVSEDAYTIPFDRYCDWCAMHRFLFSTLNRPFSSLAFLVNWQVTPQLLFPSVLLLILRSSFQNPYMVQDNFEIVRSSPAHLFTGA
jgi:hypothetical protein